jgi:MFS family permease
MRSRSSGEPDAVVTSPTRSPWGPGIQGAAITIVGILPTALLSAMVVQIGVDLDFGAAGLGTAVTIFWLANAMVSVPLGRLADRLGAIRSMRIAVVVAAGCTGSIALFAGEWWQLAVLMSLGGVSHAFGHPGANRLVVSRVDEDQRGLAFGLKAAAAPAASTLAGISVPLIALTVGWRWAFAASAIAALLLIPVIGRRPVDAQGQAVRAARPRDGDLRNRPLVLFVAISFGLGTAASMTLSVFYVASAVDAGASSQFAALTLAIGGALSIAARLVTGAICDRMRGGHMRLCAAMQLGGLIGVVLVATGSKVPMAIGIAVGLVGTWGINAIFWYALLRQYRDVPGRITGAVQPGAAIGGVIGPSMFGFIAEHGGYVPAWTVASVVTLVAATTTFMVARAFDRDSRIVVL